MKYLIAQYSGEYNFENKIWSFKDLDLDNNAAFVFELHNILHSNTSIDNSVYYLVWPDNKLEIMDWLNDIEEYTDKYHEEMLHIKTVLGIS